MATPVNIRQLIISSTSKQMSRVELLGIRFIAELLSAKSLWFLGGNKSMIQCKIARNHLAVHPDVRNHNLREDLQECLDEDIIWVDTVWEDLLTARQHYPKLNLSRGHSS